MWSWRRHWMTSRHNWRRGWVGGRKRDYWGFWVTTVGYKKNLCVLLLSNIDAWMGGLRRATNLCVVKNGVKVTMRDMVTCIGETPNTWGYFSSSCTWRQARYYAHVQYKHTYIIQMHPHPHDALNPPLLHIFSISSVCSYPSMRREM